MGNLEKEQLTIGFVPLTDSAPLVIAKSQGFFAEQGLQVRLEKQNSWATLRDKLHEGVLDAAQMLAPMPLASSMGLGCYPTPIITPFVLSLNGNAITLSDALYQEVLQASELDDVALPLNASLLRAAIEQRKSANKARIRFANVFPYSCHHYQLLDWLKSGGISSDEVDILTVPPVNMVGFLETGEIDAFCVGGPWNAKAVRSGIGLTALTSFDIWENMPEKVLGVSKAFSESNPETVKALCCAVERACHWLEATPNRFEAARFLSSSDYLDAPLDVIAPSLIGSCLTHRDAAPRHVELYNQFYSRPGQHVNKPFVASGAWLLDKMLAAGQVPESVKSSIVVADIFREDLYDHISSSFVRASF